MKRVVFSTTYDIESYTFGTVTEEEFARLETLRNGAPWVETEETGNGVWATYHGPA